VLVWDAAHARLVMRAAHGYRADTVARISFAPDEGITGVVLRTRRTVLSEDLHADPRASVRINALTDAEGIRSLICVPIVVAGEVYGLFNASYRAPRAFRSDDSRPFEALAQRAALAIENARLFEQAQAAAALEERQRLARELHDAVMQTLFSASLIAEVLPRLWQRGGGDVAERLEELRQLTRGALAEMRTLLLELRPAALTDSSMGELLGHLAEAFVGRARVPVEQDVRADVALPPDVQVAFYRIAQEALNNVAKHAEATRVVLRFASTPAGAELRIADDGRGFLPGAGPPGHFGLGIMGERARAIGAALRVESQPGQGTVVTATWAAGAT
jgi:two-component system nitrate/nitrite sensor histidine kinase NarX